MMVSFPIGIILTLTPHDDWAWRSLVASPASTSTTTAPMLRHKERTKELYMVFIVGSKNGETCDLLNMTNNARLLSRTIFQTPVLTAPSYLGGGRS
jgi:hypothetical protein